MKRFVTLAVLSAFIFASCVRMPSDWHNRPETAGAYDIRSSSAVLPGRLYLPDKVTGTMEYGILCSFDETFPPEATRTVAAGPLDEDNCFSVIMSGLVPLTTYYYKAYLLLPDGELKYGKTLDFRTVKEVPQSEAVDMGLSVRWASCNLGASSPEEYGFYYAWGEIVPKTRCSWSDYLWSASEYTGENTAVFTKYIPEEAATEFGYEGFFDDKLKLDLKDDAANVELGGDWRTPTKEEWEELINPANCSWKWTVIDGVAGYKVITLKSGCSSNWIFLPAAGYVYDTTLGFVGEYGFYSSSSLYPEYPYYADIVRFTPTYVYSVSGSRCYGRNIRPVVK